MALTAVTPITPINTSKNNVAEPSIVESVAAKPSTKRTTKNFTITLPIELYDQLEDFKFTERKKSMSGLLVEAAREYLDKYGK